MEPNTSVLTQRSKDILTSLANSGASEATTNLNRLLAGQGLGATANNSGDAIRIKDFVKQMNIGKKMKNGGGLRLA